MLCCAVLCCAVLCCVGKQLACCATLTKQLTLWLGTRTAALDCSGAAWAALEYPDADIRCITFGSPRVANKVFGKAFHALVGTSLRLVHGFDPVPSLPPSLM